MFGANGSVYQLSDRCDKMDKLRACLCGRQAINVLSIAGKVDWQGGNVLFIADTLYMLAPPAPKYLPSDKSGK